MTPNELAIRRWTPVGVCITGMALLAARVFTWQWIQENSPVRMTLRGERLYTACLLSLVVLPASSLLALLFSKRTTLASVLTHIFLIVLGVAGGAYGVIQHWSLFGDTPVSTVASPDGKREAHLFHGGLWCRPTWCLSESRAIWCRDAKLRTDLKCGTEHFEWTSDGGVALKGERDEPIRFLER